MRITLLLLWCAILGGCAVGVSPSGEFVIGTIVGSPSPESQAAMRQTGGHAGAVIGGLIAGPGGAAAGQGIGELVGWGLAALGLGGTAIAARRATTNGVKAAELQGREQGWEEREKAASVQAPLAPGATP